MRFYTFVMKNVGRRRVRSLLTIVGMAIAVGAVVALVGISKGFEHSFMAIYEKQKVDLIVQQKGAKDRLTAVLPEKLGDTIEAIPGVRQVNTGLLDLITLEGAGPIGVLVQGWKPDSVLMKELDILEGRTLNEKDQHGILLGEVLSEKFDKRPGDKMIVFDDQPPFEIIGVYKGSTVYEDGSMIMLLGMLQQFMGRQGLVNGFTVVLDKTGDDAEIERVQGEIKKLGANIEVTPTKQFVESTGQIQLVRAMSWLTSVIALIIGAVGMLNTMFMSVFERTKEIGILRAIGWRKSRVMRMILLEALILSVTGGVVGATLAILMTRFLGSLPFASGLVAREIPSSVIVQGFVIAILVGLLGAAYPAYRGAQLHPTEALRHE